MKKETLIENYSAHQQILNKWFKFCNKNFFYKIAVPLLWLQKNESYVWKNSFLVKLQILQLQL